MKMNKKEIIKGIIIILACFFAMSFPDEMQAQSTTTTRADLPSNPRLGATVITKPVRPLGASVKTIRLEPDNPSNMPYCELPSPIQYSGTRSGDVNYSSGIYDNQYYMPRSRNYGNGGQSANSFNTIINNIGNQLLDKLLTPKQIKR